MRVALNLETAFTLVVDLQIIPASESRETLVLSNSRNTAVLVQRVENHLA